MRAQTEKRHGAAAKALPPVPSASRSVRPGGGDVSVCVLCRVRECAGAIARDLSHLTFHADGRSSHARQAAAQEPHRAA
jgi:hypothetical protein